MKLIELHITPDGNEHGNIMEIIIDHDPYIFKPCYVHVGRQADGTMYLMEAPPNISEEQRQQAINHAYVIMDMVHDMICKF
jgi:hypothetical protein